MTKNAKAASVRHHLSEATRPVHESLHTHPLLEKLLQPDLSRAELEANTAVTLTALTLVERERQRLGLWPELSVARQAALMARDLGPRSTPDNDVTNPFSFCSSGLLGALYVTHGSAFGSAVISKTVRCVFPEAPHSFFLSCHPPTWRYLCQVLEGLSPSAARVAEEGARRMFCRYKMIADHELENLTAAPAFKQRMPSAHPSALL